MLVTGPDEVADLDFFDRLGGVRRARVSRACPRHGDKRPGNKAVRGGATQLLDADGQDRQKRQGAAQARVASGDVRGGNTYALTRCRSS